MVLNTKPMLDYVNKGIEKVEQYGKGGSCCFMTCQVKTSPWTGPLGITLKVTGEICSLAGDAGVPVIGIPKIN